MCDYIEGIDFRLDEVRRDMHKADVKKSVDAANQRDLKLHKMKEDEARVRLEIEQARLAAEEKASVLAAILKSGNEKKQRIEKERTELRRVEKKEAYAEAYALVLAKKQRDAERA